MGLEFVELVIKTERHFQIKLPDSAGEHIRTVGDYHELIVELAREQRPELLKDPAFFDYSWTIIAKLASGNGLFCKPDVIKRETRFIEDLGYG